MPTADLHPVMTPIPKDPPLESRVSRLRAALTHLLGSVLVVGCVAALVFGIWYPGPFRILAGGTTLFLILAAVDVVMGPTLTAVVFSPAKSRRELALDLGLILLLQLGALGYGVWTMSAARPVLLAFEVDLFRVVNAVQVVDEQMPEAPVELRALPWTGPRLIGTSRPGGERQVEATLLGLSGVHLSMQPRYWVPFEAQRAEVWRRGQPVAGLAAEQQRRLVAALKPWPGATLPSLEQLRWLPVLAPRAAGTALVDHAGNPVALAAIELQ